MDLKHIELIDSDNDNNESNNKNIKKINNKSLCIKILISLFISCILLCTWIIESNILNHEIIIRTKDDSSNRCLLRSYEILIFGYVLIITSSIIIILEIIATVYTILRLKKMKN